MKITEQRLRKIIKTLLNEADASASDINDIKKKISIKDINTVKMLLIELDKNKKDLKEYTTSNEDTRNLKQRIRRDKRDLYKLVNKHIKAISSVVGGDKKAKSIYWRNSWTTRSASKIQANIIEKISNASGSKTKKAVQKAVNQAADAAATVSDNPPSSANKSKASDKVKQNIALDYVGEGAFGDFFRKYNKSGRNLLSKTNRYQNKSMASFFKVMKRDYNNLPDGHLLPTPFSLTAIKKIIDKAGAEGDFQALISVIDKALNLGHVDDKGEKKNAVREIYKHFRRIEINIENVIHRKDLVDDKYLKSKERKAIAFWSKPQNYSDNSAIKDGFNGFLKILNTYGYTDKLYTHATILTITDPEMDKINILHKRMKKLDLLDTHIDEMFHSIG